MFDFEGRHVFDVHHGYHRLVIDVGTDIDLAGCSGCGVLAVGNRRRKHRASDAPCFGLPVLVIWRKRIWRCGEPGCAMRTFSEIHQLIARRGAG